MHETAFRAKVLADGFAEPVSREWAADTVNEVHTHDFAAAILVLDGEITVTYEGRSETCRAGDTFMLDAGIEHVETVGEAGVRFLAARR